MKRGKRFRCKRLAPDQGPGVADRQQRIIGWDQAALEAGTALVIGAGGIGGQVGYSLVKMGIGSLLLTDHDTVSVTNLNRQHFTARDLYKPKAPALARELARAGSLGSTVTGYPLTFLEFRAEHPKVVPDVVVAAVDNNKARLDAASWCLGIGRPLVSVGIARDASGGYVFVQRPGGPCLACYLGSRLTQPGRSPCPGTPAVVDVLQVVCGFAAHAVRSLAMKQPLGWNVARGFLASGFSSAVAERSPGCPLCGTRAVEPGNA